MFKRKIALFKLLGFTVSLDVSWGIILFLVVWSLSKGFFPSYFPGLSPQTYWWMGVIGAIGLFISIIIHEFSHALIARKYGLKIKGITLFIFGGVAEMQDEPSTPKSEFFMAIAGPIASFTLSIIFSGLAQAAETMKFSVPVVALLGYLSTINLLVAIFNLIPAFPTDGGRVLRSFLWWIKGDIHWGTQIASRISLLFAVVIIFMGFMHMIGDNPIGGLWWILIGSFLFFAANASYQRLVIKESFEGKTVRHFMNPSPVSVPFDITLQTFVERYLYRYHYKMFPVVKEGKIFGVITVQMLKLHTHEEWKHLLVGEVMEAQNPSNSIDANTPIDDALNRMNESGYTRLLVVEHHKVVGIITLKDLLEYIALKMELETIP
ncbi:site-2 protease family protein [Sulfurovum sp. XGS-02]|uniref:site-2 protease family protein n=1 Tax=Sulfurovum sp. XGS-02 TaxID=2925411 RepID=UPI00206B5972|nr:site-2 protease family protein [Sulfurovum sp. XGS-02]UPT77695.1 site-2 protease family protein [Sulfurovum sp. XGS-02]